MKVFQDIYLEITNIYSSITTKAFIRRSLCF